MNKDPHISLSLYSIFMTGKVIRERTEKGSLRMSLRVIVS